jgi:flavin reductase (DIM6/NTAB) family NADH-FMN oxidoreductase RutF
MTIQDVVPPGTRNGRAPASAAPAAEAGPAAGGAGPGGLAGPAPDGSAPDGSALDGSAPDGSASGPGGVAGGPAGPGGGPGGAAGEEFRAAFRRFPAGVAVVSALAGGRPAGFTATSLVSVSLDPPLVSFCVGLQASCWPAIQAAEHFGVSMLAAHQEPVARRFATSGIDRFAGTGWHLDPPGVPLLDDAAAWLTCRIEHRLPAGDHTLVIGRVLRAAATAETAPLIYHTGRYLRPT